MTEEQAKQWLIQDSKQRIKKIKSHLDAMERDILGEKEGLCKQKTCELTVLDNFIDEHLATLTLESFAEYMKQAFTHKEEMFKS